MELKKIDPNFLYLYQWEGFDSLEYYDIIIKFLKPQIDFNFKFSLPNSKSIICEIPNQIPFIAGELEGEILDIFTEKNEMKFQIRLMKLEKKQWKRFIINPIDNIIDPKSSFQRYLFNHKIEDLLAASTQGFPNALNYLGLNLIITKTDIEKGNQLLEESYEIYNDSIAEFYLYAILQENPTANEVIAKLELNGNNINSNALSQLGLIKSPLEYPHWGVENAEDAYIYFQRSLSIDPFNSDALYGLSHLYFEGIFVKKNLNASIELFEKAIQKNPNLPNFIENSNFNNNSLIIGSITTLTVITLSYYFYKKYKKN